MAGLKVKFLAAGLSRKLSKAAGRMPKEVLEAVKISARDVQERARSSHKFVSRSGQAERSIDKLISGSGSLVRGEVFTALPQAVYQHQGTKPHRIVPRSKTVLRWTDGGKFIFAKRSQVAGIKPDPFIFNAYEKEKPAIKDRFEQVTKKLLGS